MTATTPTAQEMNRDDDHGGGGDDDDEDDEAVTKTRTTTTANITACGRPRDTPSNEPT